LKWFKPARGDLQIHYTSDSSYEPDFVVETRTGKFLCEPKRASEMNDSDVLAKAEAAAVWCQHASNHAGEYGGKSWTYLLIPHDQIADQMTLAGLAARHTYEPLTDACQWSQRMEAAVSENRAASGKAARKHTVADLIKRYLDTIMPHKRPSNVDDRFIMPPASRTRNKLSKPLGILQKFLGLPSGVDGTNNELPTP